MKIKRAFRRFLNGLRALAVLAVPFAAEGAEALPACFGEAQPLVVSSQMPYALVTLAGRQGYFVLDFGATFSTVVPDAFFGPLKPRPQPGQSDTYDDFNFFGSWGQVRLPAGGVSGLRGSVPQAGIIGTDFLASHIYTLDYPQGRLHRAGQGRFCTDEALSAAGFSALSTRDYYADGPGRLTCPRAGSPACPNVPAVPVRIGPVVAVAQLDTGYDDSAQPLSVNINVALFDALQKAGVRLQARPEIALQLTTCQPGVSEAVDAWQLPSGTALDFIGPSGRVVRSEPGVTLFVKRTPPAARVCGGIGTWPQPAAQLGASFFAGGALIVDPFSARVWFRNPAAAPLTSRERP
ncbi:hypothetical protein [Zoogloea sp.]|uniref:hypothetical protein n=1 Tax=Zoogloea sp. TaxID=49181 RepID=UPI0025DB425C|nr:hypothetical protein [Zoogloea sp.]MCK6393191.1 hypothetical protein [Zoogloea sp.]